MREQVSEALMDPKAIDEERGVIAGEERTRNSPGLRLSRKQLPVIARGQKIADRVPIGDLEIIRTAPRDRFVEFYRSYYRPSRATIIAVGDFDPAIMEAKIRAAFSDWRATGPDGAEPDLGQVAAHGPETHIFVEPGVAASVALSWVGEPDLAPDTVANRRDKLIADLGIAVINRRLGELSRDDDAPFLSGSVSRDTLARSLSISGISAVHVEGRWPQALAAIEQEYRRAIEFGVTAAELQREIVDYRTALKNRVASMSTRQTPGIADGLLASVGDRNVFTSPQTDLDLFEASVGNLHVEAVNRELRELFSGGGPLTMITSPVPIDGGEAAVSAALRASQQVAVAPPKMMAAGKWPYTDFGRKGVVTGRRTLADIGATVVTFANGTTLTVKPTGNTKDRVSVAVKTGGGEFNFSPDRYSPHLSMITGMTAGGLGKMNVDEIARALNGRTYGGGLTTLGESFLLSGTTSRADLQLEMQFLAAHMTDSEFRSQGWKQATASYPAVLDAMMTTPSGAFSINARGLLAGGDLRQAIASPETLAGWSMDALRDELKALLGDGPVQITMVGDVTLERAIAVTASTFAALPARPPLRAPVPGGDRRAFPSPTPEPLRFTHKGAPNQALGYIAWPTVDSVRDLNESRRLDLFSAVVRLRATEEIRERQALAYGAGVGAFSSQSFKDYGMISIQAETAPEKLPAFFAAVDKIVRELQEKPIGEDELNRARAPLIENIKRGPSQNMWWLNNLLYVIDRPSYIPQILRASETLEAVTPADIQSMARKYLRPDSAWKAVVEPASDGKTHPVAGGSAQ